MQEEHANARCNNQCLSQLNCLRRQFEPPWPFDAKIVDTLADMPVNLSMRDFAAETHLVVVPRMIFSSHLSVYHLVRSFVVLLFAFSSRRSHIFPFALHWLQQFEKR